MSLFKKPNFTTQIYVNNTLRAINSKYNMDTIMEERCEDVVSIAAADYTC